MPIPSASDTRLERQRRLAWLQALAQDARPAQRAAALATWAAGAVLVAQMGVLAWLLDQALARERPLAELVMPLLALAVLAIARSGLVTAAQACAGRVADAAKLAFRTRVHAAVQQRGPLWLRRQRTGKLSELLVSHADALDGHHAGYQLARAELLAVPLLIALAVASVDWVVALILLITAPWVPVFMMLVGWGAEAAGRQQLQAMARLGAHFADRLKGLGLLRVYGRGADELAGVARAADGVQQGAMRVLRIAFLSSTVLEFFASISVALVALYFGLSHLGLLHLRAQVPSLGVAMFCLLLAPEFYAPFRRLAAHYHDRANALAAVAEVERLLGELPAAPSAALPVAEESAVWRNGRFASNDHEPILALNAVTLRPQGATRDVVQHASLAVRRGEWLALVGPSGSGKSTLLEAAAGWLVPREGTRTLAPGARVAYAGQRPYLFRGTIADNLRLACPQASDAAVQAAAEAAQVLRFARRLPQGLDTVIGERGFGLSGGEARRIALARALLREPDVLLLDEPTAFLDPDTEAALLLALGEFARGRSVIVATHSPAAMRWAHRVVDVVDVVRAGQLAVPRADPAMAGDAHDGVHASTESAGSEAVTDGPVKALVEGLADAPAPALAEGLADGLAERPAQAPAKPHTLGAAQAPNRGPTPMLEPA